MNDTVYKKGDDGWEDYNVLPPANERNKYVTVRADTNLKTPPPPPVDFEEVELEEDNVTKEVAPPVKPKPKAKPQQKIKICLPGIKIGYAIHDYALMIDKKMLVLIFDEDGSIPEIDDTNQVPVKVELPGGAVYECAYFGHSFVFGGHYFMVLILKSDNLG